MLLKAEKPVLLLGGLPGADPYDVLAESGSEFGELPIGFTDGETNERRRWITFVAMRAWQVHPDVQVVRFPGGEGGSGLAKPRSYADFLKLAVRPGVERIEVPTISYPIEARSSYLIFCNLRAQGMIPKTARFQFCLPFPEDATRLFANSARDFEIMTKAYADAILRDVMTIARDIPAHDLVLQWDVNWETIAIAFNDYTGEAPLHYRGYATPRQRYVDFLHQLCAPIPAPVQLGLHLCYGDFDHRHFLEPPTLAPCVEMANLAIAETGRRIDYVHMPVPLARTDDAYFAPLSDLRIGDTTLYIGAVHYADGVAGTLRRLEVFKRHFDGRFGIATECGMGRRPPDQTLSALAAIHREAVAAM